MAFDIIKIIYILIVKITNKEKKMEEYRPIIRDQRGKIRKTVNAVRKKTKIDKSIITERMMLYSVENLEAIFPEVVKNG